MMRSTPLLLATVALLSACTAADSTGSASVPTGGTMIIAPSGDATDIFPPFVGDFTGRMVQDLIFDRLAEINAGLVTIGDKGFSPRLATKWTWALDSLSIAFSLDPRARWHDGKPVTARDVKYSFDVYKNPKVASVVAPLIGNLDSVSIRDSLTPVVWFKKRTPEQFYDVAYQIVVIPEHVYGSIPPEKLRTSTAAHNPIGTGRFRFVKWDPGTRMELIADTANFRGRAKLDRVIIAPAESQIGGTQLLAGQVDFVDAFPVDRADELTKSTTARPIVMPLAGYTFFGMSRFVPKSKTAPHPIFSDKRVRRALAMSVDRVAMLQNVFGSDGRLAHGPFPGIVSYADTMLQVQPFDTTAARALLDSAGWHVGPNGIRAKGGRQLRFNIVIPTTSLYRRRYGVLMQAQFLKLGAQADLDFVDYKTVMERQRTGDFDTILWTFQPDPSPTGTKQNWGTSGIADGGQNLLRYSNPVVDALLDSSSAAFDPTQMRHYSSRAFQAIIADVPAIFLYDVTQIYGVNRRITVGPMRTDEWWADLADWTIPTDKRIERDRIGLRPPTS
jgi:peptide/nickel transport system substrate-binding protein